MSAAERIAALDDLPAAELCRRTSDTLDELARVMNEETVLLRAGRYRDAGELAAQKTQLAQDYVSLVRSVQRQSARLLKEAPAEVKLLRGGHDKLATQMAENLRVIATARFVTENLLSDVATSVGQQRGPRTYDKTGEVGANSEAPARGIAVNRAS
jgi:flagellar biosynthesis/type III secretory pathway chaperone